jgi:UDP-4-amino-4,6-dideoxy-N-acetyl-beta-L-altrosamine transaminase
MKLIPYAKQYIDKADIDAVIDVLHSDFLTQGPVVEKFENAMAAYCGARYAVAVSSATAALHISCIAAGLNPLGRLWTSPNTFVASANCARYCGASVDFVDIDSRTYNMSVDVLEEKLKKAEKSGTLPQILVPVHFAGQSCEMDKIKDLSLRYGFTVIEDASHAIGGEYQGVKIGSCSFSDMTVLSFHPVKIITTGEGGMVLTNSLEHYQKLLRLRTHGITRDTDQMTRSMDGPWYYEQVDLGFNYRLTDIQAALGASQINKIDQFIDRRQELAERYGDLLAELPLERPYQHPDALSAYHLYPVQIKLKKIKKTQREVFEALRGLGILVNLHYIPVHLQPYYQKLGFVAGQFPASEAYYSRAMSLPMYYSLTDEEQNRVVTSLKTVLV